MLLQGCLLGQGGHEDAMGETWRLYCVGEGKGKKGRRCVVSRRGEGVSDDCFCELLLKLKWWHKWIRSILWDEYIDGLSDVVKK